MLNIKRFVFNLMEENCYVVSDETREAVIIDCGAQYEEERQAIVNYIIVNRLKPVHLLCTHGHFDHIFGNDTIWKAFGLKPEVAEEELSLMEMKQQVKELLGADYDREVPPVGRLFLKDDIINFGSHHLTVIATPGHTAGSVTFYCKEEEVAFTGDTLFRMSIGRTDLGGNWNDMMQSLHRLAQLPASTKVYPGHEGTTTIGDERQYNPHMRGC